MFFPLVLVERSHVWPRMWCLLDIASTILSGDLSDAMHPPSLPPQGRNVFVAGR